MIRLGVNIDHIATLRQARREGVPDLLEAARVVMTAGADGVVIHLREDRRHIQDADVFAIREAVSRLDLEMAATDEIIKIAKTVNPTYATLVPERREELTTEGGLDVVRHFSNIQKAVGALQESGIAVSLFVDPVLAQIDAAKKSGAGIIELHTGAYANAQSSASRQTELEIQQRSAEYAASLGIQVNAGHGLTLENVGPIAHLPHMEELNIGFSIIARAVFVGLAEAVAEMKRAIEYAEAMTV